MMQSDKASSGKPLAMESQGGTPESVDTSRRQWSRREAASTSCPRRVVDRLEHRRKAYGER